MKFMIPMNMVFGFAAAFLTAYTQSIDLTDDELWVVNFVGCGLFWVNVGCWLCWALINGETR